MENMHVAAQREGIRALLSRWSSTHEQKRALELLDFVGLTQAQGDASGQLILWTKKVAGVRLRADC